MTYQEHSTLPDYAIAKWENGEVLNKGELPLWSVGNKHKVETPPAIGQRIYITMNNCGPAIVTGYFTQDGWLGVRCTLLDPPEWHRRQNNGVTTGGHIFGPEMRLE